MHLCPEVRGMAQAGESTSESQQRGRQGSGLQTDRLPQTGPGSPLSSCVTMGRYVIWE